MEVFNLHILTATKTFYEGDCESIVIPTPNGRYGIQANHQDMMAAIIPGKLELTIPGEKKKRIAAISTGVAIVEDNDVQILSESAEWPEEIDIVRAEMAAKEAEEELKNDTSSRQILSAEARIARALNRLSIKKEFGDK